jgi:hypothetical protein
LGDGGERSLIEFVERTVEVDETPAEDAPTEAAAAE